MKKILFVFIILFSFSNIFAFKVDTSKAFLVAKNFLNEHKIVEKQEISLKLISDKKKSNNLFYIFDINNSTGFIIVSANDQFQPVIAYSFESGFFDTDTKPPAYYEWLNEIEEQMYLVLNQKLKPDKEVVQKWEKYSDKKFQAIKNVKAVSPLLETSWNQGHYYNELCPVCSSGGSGGHVWAGCVATSMAQVMKFWNYPDYGSGEHSYTHYTYGEQSADFAGTYYDWAAMPNSVSSSNIAVATLLYHCGVAVNMNYAPSGSGAYMSSAANALKNYFDYSKDLKLVSKYSYSNEQWDSLIMAQIDAGQPLSYSGGSHAFNVDGYKDSSYFHLNWGWGGSYNGYFYLSDLTPGSYNFNSGQQAIINIRPNCGDASSETDTIFEYSGTIYDNGGPNYKYLNCSDSKILISPEKATNIFLSFEYFESVKNQDTLFIYDGNDESAPLLLEITGDTIPDDILGSKGEMFLVFKSDNFTTDKGFKLNFTASFDDVGITQMLLPVDRTCGKTEDSLLVIVKNYGISSQNNIPIEIIANTPSGNDVYNSVFSLELQRNEIDTFFVGFINTLDAGKYQFTCYTKLLGDSLVNNNDTIEKTINIKPSKLLPYFENVDSLDYNMGDWRDLNWNTWISGGYGGTGHDNNSDKYFSSMVSNYNEQFFIYDRKFENITQYSGVYFDYSIFNAQSWPPVQDTLGEIERINIIVSIDCGQTYDTVFTIDNNNHIPDTNYKTIYVPLNNYAGEKIIFGFNTKWDTQYSEIHYDNILFVDSINNNSINETVACASQDLTIIGTQPEGGIGEYVYSWQKSDDGLNWTSANGTNNEQNYSDDNFVTSAYFRRIVADTMYYSDTSEIVFADVNDCTNLQEKEKQIVLFPNPTTGYFIINGIGNSDFNRIEIVNIHGQKLYFHDFSAENPEINISSFEKGIYFIKIISDDEVIVKRIIKE